MSWVHRHTFNLYAVNIDLVYVVSNKSAMQDIELRYSLRSVEKHLTGVNNIWIVGYVPGFIQGVKAILAMDGTKIPDMNMLSKISTAIENHEISNPFLLFYDDHYLLSDFQADTFPYFYQGTIQDYISKRGKDTYGRRALNTMKHLTAKGLPIKNFDIHHPILIQKQGFKEAFKDIDLNKQYGYTIKSLYANSLRIEGTETVDAKSQKLPSEGDKVFSTYPIIKSQILKFLESTFPDKSRYEI